MTLDFTLNAYRQLCRAMLRLDCPVMTVGRFLRASRSSQPAVILRHDVDRALPTAMRMARLEASLGLKATYYVRTTRAVFKPDALRELHRLGHEVGYHYETLTRAKGDVGRAVHIFAEELARFRAIVPVETAAMHGSPLSAWNNLAVWRQADPAQFNLTGEAYLSINYADTFYFTDTGRSWGATRYNIRDHTAARPPSPPVQTTAQLIAFLQTRPALPVFINAHPNRWAASRPAWLLSATTDWAINRAKWAVVTARTMLNRKNRYA